MLADIGFVLVLMAGISSLYGAGAAVVAGRMRHRRLYRSSRMAATAATALVTAASGVLMQAFFQREYGIAYVFKNSSNDLPTLYRVTAFWSSLEGSHLLWTLMLSWFASITLWTAARDNEHIMPHVSVSLQAVLSWMFYLLVSHSDPFQRLLPAPDNGQGMNALLQNPYMAAHPPLLFMGYTALAVPAAYAVAALCFGDVTEGWLRTVRRWTIVAWTALTIGIALGGRWAYVELGWAGYWAWDPVENSSFIPWLLATALLHALVVQDKIGHLKRLTLILAFLAFFFSFFGTFITRSGIVSSVHSFAESPIGPNYLIFLAAMLFAVSLLYGFRAHSILPANAEKVWGVSRESALVITLFILSAFAAIVCVGTLYPIVSEAITGERTTVQAPYFNAFAPWIGLLTVLAIGLGTLLRFHSGRLPYGWRIPVAALVLALPSAAVLIHLTDVLKTPRPFALGAQVVGLIAVWWCLFCLVFDVTLRLRELKWNIRLFLDRNLAYLGGQVAHAGILLACVGFLGNYRGMDRVATVTGGEVVEFQGFSLKFEGLDISEVDNATLYGARLAVSRGGRDLGILKPARSKYPTAQQMHHEIGVLGTMWQDLYVTLADFDRESGNRATLEIHLNPGVRFVWISIAVMALGGLLSLGDRWRGVRSRDVVRGEA